MGSIHGRAIAIGGLALAAILILAIYVYFVGIATVATEPDSSIGARVSGAVQTPADKIPETNPFKAETNPFKEYKNPFD